MALYADIHGQRFGNLIAISPLGTMMGRRPCWLFLCDCGNAHIARKSHVTTFKTTSCGCLRQSQRDRRFRKHGMSGSPEWLSWMAMQQRCDNRNHEQYKDYGGRGITVCARWREFANFYADMGPRPNGTTLDRIDNDSGYEPGNCRWATWEQQNAAGRRRTSHRASASTA